jgi:hypothetical protein
MGLLLLLCIGTFTEPGRWSVTLSESEGFPSSVDVSCKERFFALLRMTAHANASSAVEAFTLSWQDTDNRTGCMTAQAYALREIPPMFGSFWRG